MNTPTTDETLPGLGILRHDPGQVHAYLPGGTAHDWVGTFDDREAAIDYLTWIASRNTPTA